MFFLIILGGIGNLSTWIIGPSKGLMVAIWDGCAPPCLGRVNRFDVPVVLIAIQCIAVTIMATLLYFLPLQAVYTLLTVMAAQWSLWVYVMLFLSIWRLRIMHPNHNRPYQIPGGKIGLMLCIAMGSITCVVLFLLGFIPPSSVPTNQIWVYESTLLFGMVLMLLVPLWLMRITDR
jgi:glutamate:GABA antiporter